MSTILLVQSDADAREVSREWLRQAGYFVLACASGEEALSLANVYRRKIHAVVTDLVLLHMNGIRVVKKLRENRPELRALILSDGRTPADIEGQEMSFLQSPVEHPVLVEIVRNLIGSTA
jgi:two-component system OmpR family response regulator